MARKQRHEEHQNHEAWAIPYGDLITLLLAFFVVMYAVSSVNEGKYRVLADAMSEAFGGPPKSLKPLQIGRLQLGTAKTDSSAPTQLTPRNAPTLPIQTRIRTPMDARPVAGGASGPGPLEAREREKLQKISDDVQKALGPLIDKNMVIVRRTESWIEIEIKTDILFPSGSAQLDAHAVPVLENLSTILSPYPNRIRIEGHTDNRPIATAQFPSNWELSASRASSVLRILIAHGVDARRLAVLGLADTRPKADNATPEGRNQNRRVTLVLLSDNAPDAGAGSAGAP